ncbi:hypothetical protein BDV32DRAFT_126613 [Aspergillus pseudonomiae]|uniref:Uncharacterized protein n=1 Tax=Aspergillus pseudonomiae TaxID=1506151 RepID=A0A5N6HTR0_9EURO|nr:uncharacterized protein BDV37DRAFT_239955 [Aspergillus pseudonomiae]KAB8257891.1 hypothetical protein BDV32DRAFT_126613 [Aspergillus pseudonomiae]KAE8408119.1 hypothetical protein BDV37DRAFT_239955 [Aspergillus pseudonomiae]
MSGQSSVGNRSLYEAGDQRNVPQSVLNQQDRYNEGQKHSHKNLDPKDERSIANKLAAREKQPDPSHHHNYDVNPEAEISKKDSTKPAKIHGNEPSKGAKIDQELKEEDEQRLREKGIKK